MRTTFFLFLLALIGLSSCTSNLRIEKRQHRNGFYIAGISHDEHRADDSVSRTAIQKDIPEVTIVEEQHQVKSDAPAETAQPALADTAVPQQQTSTPLEKIRSTVEKVIPVPLPKKKTAAPPYEGPVEGKRLSDMFWAACIMTAAAILIMALLLLFPGAIELFILGYLAWLAVLAAIVMNICVAAIAGDRSRFYADKDKETSDFYARLKRRALWFFAILGGSIVLFYLGILVFVLLIWM